mgnify:CR=1 FL=1
MAKKKVIAVVKLQIKAGQATPAPPVGTALGQHGVNIMDFCRQYNDATQQFAGQIIPVELTIYEDRSFSFVTKQPPAAELIRQAALGLARIPLFQGLTYGTITPQVVTHRIHLLIRWIFQRGYTMRQPLLNVYIKMSYKSVR